MCDLQQPATINHKWLPRLFCFLQENTSIYRCRLLSLDFYLPSLRIVCLFLADGAAQPRVIIITPSHTHTLLIVTDALLGRHTHTHFDRHTKISHRIVKNKHEAHRSLPLFYSFTFNFVCCEFFLFK